MTYHPFLIIFSVVNWIKSKISNDQIWSSELNFFKKYINYINKLKNIKY